MPNYKESTVAGSAWQRAYQVTISNRYNTIPTITFNEEEIMDTGASVMSRHVGYITEPMSDPTKTFALINPLDGSAIGTASYQEVYVILASLYASLAAQRDATA